MAGRGIHAAADAPRRTIDGVPTNVIWNEISEVVKLANGQRDNLLALLSFRTTASAKDVLQAYAGGEFEDASEYGEPVGYRSSVSYSTVGYPFKWRDMAQRFTWKYLIDASAEQLRSDVNAGL